MLSTKSSHLCHCPFAPPALGGFARNYSWLYVRGHNCSDKALESSCTLFPFEAFLLPAHPTPSPVSSPFPYPRGPLLTPHPDTPTIPHTMLLPEAHPTQSDTCWSFCLHLGMDPNLLALSTPSPIVPSHLHQSSSLSCLGLHTFNMSTEQPLQAGRRWLNSHYRQQHMA